MTETTTTAGRPPKGARALTDSERAAEYRKRLRVASTQITDNPGSASDKALIQALARQVRRITTGDAEDQDTGRWVAEKIIKELVTRHKIAL